jgi:hypothetical protein
MGGLSWGRLAPSRSRRSLASPSPAFSSRWRRAGGCRRGIYALASLDAALVAADLLQHPNAILAHAAPAAGLPQLQSVVVGSAAMGFGDLFIAAALGALVAAEGRPRGDAVLCAGAFGLAFNLLFFVVSELPTTVPIALTLAALDALGRRRSRPEAAALARPRPQALSP